MTSISPKRNFLTFQKGHAAELQNHRESSWFTVAATYALAEMACRNATAEQLNGARNFITVFQNLWEEDKDKGKLPVKSLQSYDLSPEEMAAKVKELLAKEQKP